MACLMLLGAKLQNVLGGKKTFLYGALIYGVGTTIAALSLNAPMLLFGWSLLEGVGAALSLPFTSQQRFSTANVLRRSQMEAHISLKSVLCCKRLHRSRTHTRITFIRL
jgi:hypothetical protein